MKEDVLIQVEGLSKKFCKDLKTSLWYGIKDLYSNIAGNKDGRALRPKEFWALKDINFELKRGECLGLIGHNGAGKSTLLKILNGLIMPDSGKVTMRGRVGALIELGAGFNPILTGRENIYNNGAVLGFSKSEIDSKLDDIIDFAEIREFIDMPVQNYSSGMKVRLGFAVAAQMEPDILIIDEILAVGDTSFRAKCFNRMVELSKTCAMIFVSHSMPLVGRICNTGILLEKGTIKNYAIVNDVIHTYLLAHSAGEKNAVGEVKLENFKVEIDKTEVKYGDDLEVKVRFKMPSEYKNFIIHYSILDLEMKAVYQAFSSENDILYKNSNDTMNVSFVVKNIDLSNGKYFMNLGFIDDNYNGKNICRYDSVAEFMVTGSKHNNFASIVKDTQWG